MRFGRRNIHSNAYATYGRNTGWANTSIFGKHANHQSILDGKPSHAYVCTRYAESDQTYANGGKNMEMLEIIGLVVVVVAAVMGLHYLGVW